MLFLKNSFYSIILIIYFQTVFNKVESKQGEVKLSQPRIKNGKYENPWSTWKDVEFWKILKFSVASDDYTSLPKDKKVQNFKIFKCFNSKYRNE